MKRVILLLAVVSAVLSSCQKEGSPEISCSVIGKHIVPYTGGSIKVYVVSNTEWTTSCVETSVVIDPASGKGDTEVTISYPLNENLNTRGDKITFNAVYNNTHAYAYVTISQECRDFLLCSNPEITADAQGGDYYFRVNSNSPWSVKSAECNGDTWYDASITPSSNEVNAVDVKVTIPAKVSDETVTYTITLALDNGKEEVVLHLIQ
ncbi:MAG: BACON domain-containing protein [Bacteroidales bacterium]|nr:BACON domain-containing protein [Candidatus Cacconaster merdequi]